MLFEYDDRDLIVAHLTDLHRTDLFKFVPQGSETIGRVGHLFWRDVIARFKRGEVWDAVTAIERRYRPLIGRWPRNNNAYHFVDTPW